MTNHARDNLLVWEVLPFAVSLAVLGASALAIDAALHFAKMVWLGKWLGILGVLLRSRPIWLFASQAQTYFHWQAC